MKLSPREIYERLDCEAVLLPIRQGTKAPSVKCWQNITYAQTLARTYQSRLDNAAAVGVVLDTGRTSLCSIDIDDDELIESFLEQNPELKVTLRTKGKKGGNFWLKIKGDYPEYHALHLLPEHPLYEQIEMTKDKSAGEWRVGNHYTIITGKHPEGMNYEVIQNKPILDIEFESINWKGFSHIGKTCSINSIDSLNDLNDLNNLKEREEKKENKPFSVKVRDSQSARNRLDENEGLSKLYRKNIETKFTPRQGERNSQLVAMVTFLYRTLSPEITITLVRYFHEINQDIFMDTLTQHEAEAMSHMKATRETWLSTLNEREIPLYDEVSEASRYHEASFRICRELATLKDDRTFYLSGRELGERIGADRTKAGRYLAQFVSLRILSEDKRGTGHSKAGTGTATTYRWLL